MEERNALPEFSGKIPPQRLAKAAAVATAPPIAPQPPANAPAENISGGAMQKITVSAIILNIIAILLYTYELLNSLYV